MRNKIYPAIYKDTGKAIYLYLNADNYYCFGRGMWDKTYDEDDHENDINITHECLNNTYGKVECKEHAEFIVELCRIHGIPTIYSSKPSEAKSFEVNKGYISLHSIGINELNVSSQKLITIPLPPKQIQTATSEEEFEMQQIMKNNGDNLILGCEDSKCEWPQIGDLVQANFGKGIVKSLADKNGILAVMTDRGFNWLANMSDIKKPKTPEEELRDELESEIKSMITFTNYNPRKIAEWIISGEIDGLSYNITKKP